MALNPNHAFEELGEIKCAIVEKNCTPERVEFLRPLLEYNGFEVVVVASPPPKVAAAPKPAAAEAAEPAAEEPLPPPLSPATFTVGVTDVTFSPINAVFNRELKTFDGKVVTTDYWKQKDAVINSSKWYWQK